MKIVGLEKLSLVDYDENISCTIFLQGCNFRCGFCHNKSLVIGDNKEMPQEEIFEYLNSRKGILDAVVITGGEPTLNEQLIDLISKIKSLGFKVKLDTNGTNPTQLKQLINLNLIDYVAMDIKSSLDNYTNVTKCSKNLIPAVEESINILINSNIESEFRTTLLAEIHDINEIKQIAKTIQGCNKYRLQKYIDSEHCIENIFTPVDKEKALLFKEELLKSLKDVDLRSY